MTEPFRFAPPGHIWVCRACGKRSPRDVHGDRDSDRGWDASCTLNAVLVRLDDDGSLNQGSSMSPPANAAPETRRPTEEGSRP